MTDEEYFARQAENYLMTRKNKRYGRDQMEYETGWVANVVRGMVERQQRTFRVSQNYAFLTSHPRWREIFATCFEGRRADHEVCDILIPIADGVLSERTFNNRKGYGSMKAINQVIEDIAEASNGYTEPAWVIKLDMKGFFPNARWCYAENCLQQVIDNAPEDMLQGYDRSYLKWMVMILIHANPAAHCELRTPRHYWYDHIEPEKSLFSKPEGVGAAIGRLIWQTAMGLYVNDDIKWLNEDCGVRCTCFVDDIVMVVPGRLKSYALSLLPKLRERLKAKGVTVNDKKFYCQHYEHGLEFLGTHIKPHRLHLNDATFCRCINRIAEFNALTDKYGSLDMLISTVNSYSGLLKNRTSIKRLNMIAALLDEEWFKWVKWDEQRQCLTAKFGHDLRSRTDRRWGLRLRFNNRKKITA